MSKSLKEQIEQTLEGYPELTFNEKTMTVCGDFHLTNSHSGEDIETYELSIFFPRGVFNTVLPRVTEISEKIPRLVDRHIYSNGVFCLTTSLYEYLICRKGITFSQFLETIVRPFLATQTLLSLGELDSFPQGEFSHGGKGVLEGYQNYLEIDDPIETVAFLRSVTEKFGRNSLCFCSNGKKYKHCHQLLLRKKPLPSINLVKRDLEFMQENNDTTNLSKSPQL